MTWYKRMGNTVVGCHCVSVESILHYAFKLCEVFTTPFSMRSCLNWVNYLGRDVIAPSDLGANFCPEMWTSVLLYDGINEAKMAMTLDPNTVLNTYFNCIWRAWNPQKFRWLSVRNSMADLITRSHFVSAHDWWICKGDLSVPTLNFVPESSEVRIIKVTCYVVSSCLCFCVKVNVVTFCIMLLTNCGEDWPTHFFPTKAHSMQREK